MNLVLIDDHPLFRAGVRQALIEAPECHIVAERGRARDAFPDIDAHQPDIVVIDVGLPGMDGIVATREILRRAPRCRVLILTMYDQLSDVLDALAAGASGYALKSDDPATLVAALRTLARGERYIAPSVAARLGVAREAPGLAGGRPGAALGARAGGVPPGRRMPAHARDRARAVHFT